MSDASVYGSPNKGPYIVAIIAAFIAVVAFIFDGPSEDDITSAVKTAKTELMGRIATKADSAVAYANLAANSDVENLRDEVATLSDQVIEVEHEVLGYAEVIGDDSTGYGVKYNPGLKDLIRGRRDTVEVIHDGNTLRTTVRIAAMPSGAEMQQAINHDLPRVMAATWSGGLPTPEALAFAQTYRREVGLNTSKTRSDAKFAEGFQKARTP